MKCFCCCCCFNEYKRWCKGRRLQRRTRISNVVTEHYVAKYRRVTIRAIHLSSRFGSIDFYHFVLPKCFFFFFSPPNECHAVILLISIVNNEIRIPYFILLCVCVCEFIKKRKEKKIEWNN